MKKGKKLTDVSKKNLIMSHLYFLIFTGFLLNIELFPRLLWLHLKLSNGFLLPCESSLFVYNSSGESVISGQ